MLWPFILQLQIAFCSLAVFVMLATLIAPLFRLKRSKAFFTAVVLGCLLLIPAANVVMPLIDARRFGVFQYATFADVQDPRVERYLPPGTTDLTVEKRAMGFRARFKIAQSDLQSFVDDHWARFGERSTSKRGELSDFPDFDDLGWPPLPEDAQEYFGPTAPNGAGYQIWYSPSLGEAYEDAAYW